MTWHLTKIPKIAHFFWDNKPLSFLRWMSMHSFSVLNPDWTLKLHVTTDDTGATWTKGNNKQRFEADDYRSWLPKIDRLEIIQETDFPGLHGVHQSDILRNRYLSEDGGLWSDVDILYHRPMDGLACNDARLAQHDTGLCVPNNRWFPIAFMFGSPGATFFQDVHHHQLAIFKSSGARGDYQKFGTKVYRYVFQRGDYDPFYVARNEVYQKTWQYHGQIFNGQINPALGVGIHWYGGSASAAIVEPKMTHENWQDFPLSHVIRVTL